MAHLQRTKSRPLKAALTLAYALTVDSTSRAQVIGFRVFEHLISPLGKHSVLVDTRPCQVWSLEECNCFREGTVCFGKSSRPSRTRSFNCHGSLVFVGAWTEHQCPGDLGAPTDCIA